MLTEVKKHLKDSNLKHYSVDLIFSNLLYWVSRWYGSRASHDFEQNLFSLKHDASVRFSLASCLGEHIEVASLDIAETAFFSFGFQILFHQL